MGTQPKDKNWYKGPSSLYGEELEEIEEERYPNGHFDSVILEEYNLSSDQKAYRESIEKRFIEPVEYRTKTIIPGDDKSLCSDKSQQAEVFQTYDDADEDDERPKHLRFADPLESEEPFNAQRERPRHIKHSNTIMRPDLSSEEEMDLSS